VKQLAWALLGLCAAGSLLKGMAVAAPQKLSSPVLSAMQAELRREMNRLGKEPTPPYFLSYEITDTQFVGATASFGQLVWSNQYRHRQLDIDLRVGSYDFDNTHLLRGDDGGGPQRFTLLQMPLEDDPNAIRVMLWSYTDRKYKQALEQYTKAKTNAEVAVEQEDKSADFSREASATSGQKLLTVAVDRLDWEERVKRYTAPFAKLAHVYAAEASLSANVETRWFVNSEGSAIETSQPLYRLALSATTKADDGMVLPRYESFAASTPEGLPDVATALKAVDHMIEDLEALRKAPVVDPYTGPAVLSGRASGVFFHEVFGHRIEGHRQKNVRESQTFKRKVGERILPDNFSIYFDPTLRRAGNADLVGSYEFDNQGVKARRVTVVDHGIFKSFLMSRTPIEAFPNSNGHGRKQPGFAPVARQSNLIVEVTQPVSKAELKQMLIEQIKQEGRPFGLYFDDIQGGFTLTGRNIPNAFQVLPIMVYKVYPDRREELVRGVDLIGTPLTAFSKIVAADDTVEVFNGVCGAESGGVPVATVSPSILISQIEVQKKEKAEERLPILPAPFEEQSAVGSRQPQM
jgi:predicted Zn-dependent protease